MWSVPDFHRSRLQSGRIFVGGASALLDGVHAVALRRATDHADKDPLLSLFAGSNHAPCGFVGYLGPKYIRWRRRQTSHFPCEASIDAREKHVRTDRALTEIFRRRLRDRAGHCQQRLFGLLIKDSRVCSLRVTLGVATTSRPHRVRGRERRASRARERESLLAVKRLR